METHHKELSVSFPQYLSLAVVLVLLIIFRQDYKKHVLPRQVYLKLIFEREWKNRIILLHEVQRELGKEISFARNIWNLDQLVREKLIEQKDDTTWLQGDHQISTVSYKITDKGFGLYHGSPP